MTTWKQYTYVNGELKYEPRVRTDADLVGLFAQCHFLRDAGETIAFSEKVDEHYHPVVYQMIRCGSDRVIYHEYHKMTSEGEN